MASLLTKPMHAPCPGARDDFEDGELQDNNQSDISVPEEGYLEDEADEKEVRKLKKKGHKRHRSHRRKKNEDTPSKKRKKSKHPRSNSDEMSSPIACENVTRSPETSALQKLTDMLNPSDGTDIHVLNMERKEAVSRTEQDERDQQIRARKQKQSHEFFERQRRRIEASKHIEPRSVCRYYRNGGCFNANCPFLHEGPVLEKKKELCRFYAAGSCIKGDCCNYMHKEFPCRDFHTGLRNCAMKERCKYSHEPLTPDTFVLLNRYADDNPQEKFERPPFGGRAPFHGNRPQLINAPGPIYEFGKETARFPTAFSNHPPPFIPRIRNPQDRPVCSWSPCSETVMMPPDSIPRGIHPVSNYPRHFNSDGRIVHPAEQAVIGYPPGLYNNSVPQVTTFCPQLPPRPVVRQMLLSTRPVENSSVPVFGLQRPGQSIQEFPLSSTSSDLRLPTSTYPPEVTSTSANIASPAFASLTDMVKASGDDIETDLSVLSDSASASRTTANQCLAESSFTRRSPVASLEEGYAPHTNSQVHSFAIVQRFNVENNESTEEHNKSETDTETALQPVSIMNELNQRSLRPSRADYYLEKEWILLPLHVPVKVPYPLMQVQGDLPHKFVDPRLQGQPTALRDKKKQEGISDEKLSVSENFGSNTSDNIEDILSVCSFGQQATDDASTFKVQLNNMSSSFLTNAPKQEGASQQLDRAYLIDPRFKRKKVQSNVEQE